MSTRKSLYDISWKVDEPTYRQDTSLSYSTLAKYERDGFNNLNKLFDKVESPSLLFGQMVDTLITGGQEEFDSRFFVANFPSLGDKEKAIAKSLFNGSETPLEFNEIPDSAILSAANIYEFQKNWRDETRVRVLKERCSEYYNLLYAAGDKIVIDSDLYQDVLNSVDALKNSKSTKLYFAENNPFEPDLERFYQLKFKSTLNDIDYRCMADLILVDYKDKVIYPIDLKTSYKNEWDFYKSFIEWRYDIQARLYWRIIKDNLDKDEYFKDFTLHDYTFIVVNKTSLTPLVWTFADTTDKGTLVYNGNLNIRLRDPEEIGKELRYYLDNNPKVPKGIKIISSNDIVTWLNRL